MKKIFSILAMAAVVLASCVKEQAPVSDGGNEIVPSGELVEKVFTVGDIESKTYIDGTVANNKVVIKWCADDAISVWDGVANRKFTMVGEPDGASATFKGLVDAAATDFYAIYPYDENLQYSYDEPNQRKVFTVAKPTVQYANPEGGLADGSAYACGKADAEGNIKFVNSSVLLKFSLAEGMNVKSLKISGNEDDDIIAGTLDIRYTETAGYTVGWKSAGKSTELTFCNEDGSNLKTGVDYYISLIENKFDKGYAVTLTFDDGNSVTKDSDKSVHYMSNQIYSLAGQPLSMSMFETGEEGGSTPVLPDGVAIGALLEDGVIVGLADDGSYAIVMSLQSNEVYWHNYEDETEEALIGKVVGLAEMSNVDGYANTAALLSKDPDGFPAALHCRQMGEDWYLPSSSELAAVRNDLLANIDVIDATIGAKSGVKLNAANAAGEIELQEYWWTSNDLPTLETNSKGTKYYYKAEAYRFVDSENPEAETGSSTALNGYKARYVRGFKKVSL